MTPSAVRFIPKGEVDLFETIALVVKSLRDLDLGVNESGEAILLSCHMITRAVGKAFHLEVRDGYFRNGYEHSWLVTPYGHVIDVYPVGMLGGPVMCVMGNLSPYDRLYTVKTTRRISYGKFSKPSFRRSVKRIERELQLTCKRLLGK